MRTTLAFLALSLSAAGIASAAQLPPGATPERMGALMIEWTIANCPGAKVSAGKAMMASMILNGTAPDEIEPLRAFMRDGAKSNYPDRAAACADMMPRVAEE